MVERAYNTSVKMVVGCEKLAVMFQYPSLCYHDVGMKLPSQCVPESVAVQSFEVKAHDDEAQRSL